MGVHRNIGADKFPRQGELRGCSVIFNYDTGRKFRGEVVREDLEEPYLTIIRLEDGRFVLTTECQWQPDSLALPEPPEDRDHVL